MSVWTELCFANISRELSRRFSLSAANLLVFLPLSRVRILLISIWTGFTFLAKVFQSEFNQCLPKVSLTSSTKSVCSSVRFFQGGPCWCLLGLSSHVFNIFLVNSTNVCLKCLPLLVCQCLLVGHLVSCWGGLAGDFHACCPVFLNSPIHRI